MRISYILLSFSRSAEISFVFFFSVDNGMPGTFEGNNAKTCHSLIPMYYITKTCLLCFL